MVTELLYQGLVAVVHPHILLLLGGSVLLGIIAGALPGISATMGVAVVSPLTFTLPPFEGIIALVGIYVGAVYGGSVSAILLGIPGTPGAVATVIDGYAMGRKGLAGQALGISTLSSFFGGVFSVLALGLLSYPIASFALSFGAREYLALSVFALTAISSMSGGSFLRGAFSALIGMFLATVGIDEMYGISRFHFDQPYLIGGIPFIPTIIGLFAVPETLANIEKISVVRKSTLRIARILPTKAQMKSLLPAQVRSAIIGTLVGAVPGTGSDVAAIVAYSQGKNLSRHPEKFGTGYPEGVACPETGNNAATGGTMIPLLTLGIPGGAVTAIMLGAFMTHGLQPGPLLLQKNANLVYQIFVGMFFANVFMVIFGLLGARLLAKVLQIHESMLAPIILLLCVIGAYTLNSNIYDIYIMSAAGLLGYLMIKVDIPRAPLVIGLIIGPMVERQLTRTTLLVSGNWIHFFTPVSAVLWVLVVLPFLGPLIKKLPLFQRAPRPAKAE